LEWSSNDIAFIAEVDCTADGELLCTSNHIRGFPTIKWGDPHHLHDYVGSRDFIDLNRFVQDNLKPICSVINIELCDEEKRKLLESFLMLSEEEVEAKIEAEEAKRLQTEEEFNEGVKKLRDEYESIQDRKNDRIDEVMRSGLSVMKAVRVHRKKLA
jgi:hypothetical protein